MLEARLLSNLGVVEIRLGDPAVGLRLYRESERIHAEIGNNLDRVISLDNIAVVLQELGRADEACHTVEQAMDIVRRTGLDLEVPWQHEALGHSYWEAGRRAAAVQHWRAVLDFGEAAPVPARAGALLGLVTAYVETDSLETALAMLDATPERLLTGAEATVRARLSLLRAEILERLGRPAEALALTAPLAADLDRQGDAQYGLAAWVRVARLQRRLERREQARVALERAAGAWWEARARSADREVREVRGELGRELMAEVVELELERQEAQRDPAAIGRAFDRAQRFKTRTLLERVAGPGQGGARPSSWEEIPSVTVESLRRRTLAPGELLVEAVVGRDSSWLLAISRDDVRALRLAGGQALEESAGLVRDLLATPPRAAADRRAAEGAAARLGGLLLAGLGDLLARAHTLIVAPDGPLHQVPFQALVPPGSGTPLLATHRVVIVPSATLLATLRARPRGREAPGPLFAYASEAEPNAPRLRAAAGEVRSLGERFRRVVVRILSPRSPDSLGVPHLAGFAALHFAGHIRVDDQAPWRSGFAAAWPRTEDHNPMLTAGDIASHRLGARIVVLSGCESARGRVRTGEGVTGLTSSFLAAGVPTVVATLWPVDDRTTGRLMEVFYQGLARGGDAASALAAAAARLREDPATAHPFFWAGYVLVGEAGTRLALEPRPFSAPRALRWASLLALAAVVPAAWRGWRASGRRAA